MDSTALVSPLRVPRSEKEFCQDAHGCPVLQGYCEWKLSPRGGDTRESPRPPGQPWPPSTQDVAGPSENASTTIMEPHKVTLYSPLTPFFADQSHPASKKGEKVMFGQNGWLERTGETPEKKKDVQKKSIFEIMKKIEKEMFSLPLGSITFTSSY